MWFCLPSVRSKSGFWGKVVDVPKTGLRRAGNLRLAMMVAVGLAAVRSEAALELDIVTTRGTVTAELDFGRCPRTVANLLTLAQGSRNWLDPRSGRVRGDPFYTGLAFSRVVNQSGERWMETGSAGGIEGAGPGFAFPDEFDAVLVHDPYVLSMANEGPNTNGAAFLITGNVAMPGRDGFHTVFGKVASPASRAVVDAILAAGAGATVITGVTTRRTDPAAVSFDETAVSLPMVEPLSPPLKVVPGGSVSWWGSQAGGSVVRAFRSEDLAVWHPHYRRMVGLDDPLPGMLAELDRADAPAAFYWFSRTVCPDAGGVTGFAGRTVVVQGELVGTITYRFDATGMGGTYANTLLPDEPPFFSGSFTVVADSPPIFEPYSFRVLLRTPGLGGAAFNLIRGGVDSIHPNEVGGHQRILLSDAEGNAIFEDSGPMWLTRP